jgi:ubiquinone/menaquinone biosynthesis C-methylase UbiE
VVSTKVQPGSSLPAAVDPRPAQAVSLWDIYMFAYRVAVLSLDRKHAADVLRLLIEPCNYWRNVEVPAVINHLRIQPGQKVLDIGSPKLPSLFIWKCLGAEVYATDIFPYFFEEYSHYSRCLCGSKVWAEYHIEQQDARELRHPSNFFDSVYAISVLEHIENDGDSKAIGEIARVLKPGGLCCLTVPFADRYRESTIDFEVYYQKPVSGRPVFHERHYDSDSLQHRLVGPSGLSQTAVEFYGERQFPYERYYNALPHLAKIALAPAGPLFSKLCLSRTDSEGPPAPKMALIELRKQ